MASGLSSTPINGHRLLNGSSPLPNSSESSSESYHTSGYPDSQSFYPSHDQNIISYLYDYGFQRGDYADTILHAHQNVYRLHAIILSRSPLLVQLMSTSPQAQVGSPRTIYVPLDREPEVTQEGFAIALGYLYSSISLRLIRTDNARAVLAAGCMLGGMEDLCEYAYETCKRSISVDTIGSWLEFIDTIPVPSSGAETPDISPVTVFGPYAKKIRDDVFHFLVVTLPEILDVHGTSSSSAPTNSEQHGREVLLQIFSRVPFEMFKTAVESPSFQIGSDQARFKFAKDAIEIRKRGIARGPGCEETVVLAFGGGNFGGSAVHITRKMRKRPLWKVNS